MRAIATYNDTNYADEYNLNKDAVYIPCPTNSTQDLAVVVDSGTVIICNTLDDINCYDASAQADIVALPINSHLVYLANTLQTAYSLVEHQELTSSEITFEPTGAPHCYDITAFTLTGWSGIMLRVGNLTNVEDPGVQIAAFEIAPLAALLLDIYDEYHNA